MLYYTSTQLHLKGKANPFPFYSTDTFSYCILFRFRFFIPFLSSKNHVPPDVLILNVCDELKDEVFLNGLRTFSN